jgi:hypothetical protein
MNIILGENEVPILTAVGHMETGSNGVQRNIIELWTEEPLTAEDIEYIKTHDSFTNDGGGTYDNYKEVVRYSTWLAQVDPNAVIVQQVTAEKEAAIQEKEAAVQAKETLQTVTIPTLLRGRTDDVLVELLDYIPEWTEGVYVVGDVRKYEDQPKICCQAHDSTDNPSWNPTMASLWSPYHAKSAEYALPWIAPTGAQDMYKSGEYMVYTDREVYKCLQDTAYSPTDYAQAWQAV